MKKIIKEDNFLKSWCFWSSSVESLPGRYFDSLQHMQFLNTLYFNEPAKFMTLHLLPHETNLILMFFLKTTNLINSPNYLLNNIPLTATLQPISIWKLLSDCILFLVIQEVASVDIGLGVHRCKMKRIQVIWRLAGIALICCTYFIWIFDVVAFNTTFLLLFAAEVELFSIIFGVLFFLIKLRIDIFFLLAGLVVLRTFTEGIWNYFKVSLCFFVHKSREILGF